MNKGIVRLIVITLSLCLLMPCFCEAAETDIEKDLQNFLQQSKTAIEILYKKQKAGSSITEELNKLKALSENIRAADLLLKKRFDLRADSVKFFDLKAQERHRVMSEGYRKALTEYLIIVDGLPSDGTIPQSSIDNLQLLHQRILPKSKRPIHGSLPYRNLNYPAKEPDASPSIIPAYRGGSLAVRPEDTNDTPEAPLSLEIASLAQSLNWKPIAIYEYVKNNIETEWYWGCMKGAEETLRQKSGNDCDQAALLAALLRASGFPTRYIRGTIEFFPDIEKAKNLTGIDDPLKMAEFFQRAGIPFKPVIRGGKIANIQLEHIWVESRIPYGNYRGTMIDNSDPTWLGLDSSIKPKGYAYSSARDIMGMVSLSGLNDIYLKTDSNSMEPLEYIKAVLEGYLAQASPGVAYIDLLRTRTLMPESMKILPNSMQFDQKKITHEYTEIPEELKHKVRLSAFSNQLSANTDPLFDITLDAMQLSNKQIAMSYEPETVEDQEIIDSYGGLDNTPAYLVRLRPLLKVDGERVIVGRDGLPMGEDFNLTIELISPNGVERTTNAHITGNLSAIGIVAQRAISSQLSAISEEDDAETILYKEANRFIDRWNKAEDELASLLHLSITRPIPTVVTVGGVIDVTYLLDIPHGFEWKGVFIDASLRAVSIQPSAVSVGAQFITPSSEDRIKTFMQFSGLQGSVLEHRIFEDDFQVDSISTAKLIQIVGVNGGSPILTIDKTNIDTILPTLTLEENIKEDIINAVNQGLVVRMPQPLTPDPQPHISYLDWTGIGYTKENLQTNELGYMLSGMIAGGMTAVSPNKWSYQDLIDILSKPYTGQYTTVSITSPKNESILFATPITLSGIALDPNARVTVNGLEAVREGNAFTASGISLTKGINRITATATNSEGVSVSSSINVKYRLLLRTFITFPYEGANLSVQTIDVEGIVSDPVAAIEVNGIHATVSPDGRFIARNIALAEGLNQLTVKATNLEEDVDIQTLTVTRQATQAVPIQLTITEPTGNGPINRPSVLVEGTVATDADEVWIKINGQLAEVHDGQFVANHVPLTEGNNIIIVNATDSNGGVGRAEVTVTAVKRPYITLNANITSGIPPLTTYFTVSTEIPNAVTSYQMDFEGDGVIDYTGTTFEDISHAYTTEGIYYPTVTVTDDQRNMYTDTIAIVVLSQPGVDVILTKKWENMKAAFQNQNIEKAVAFFLGRSQDRYRAIFNKTKNTLAAIVAEMNPIEFIQLENGLAEYRIRKSQAAGEVTYYVYFVKDENGAWKIQQF